METDCSSDDFRTSETEARAEESVLVICATGCPEGQHTSMIDLGRREYSNAGIETEMSGIFGPGRDVMVRFEF